MSIDMFTSNPSSSYSSMGGKSVGKSFIPVKNIDVTALRIKPVDMKTWTINISDSSGNLIASKSVTTNSYAWFQVSLDTPVRLTAGNTYTIWTYCGSPGQIYRNTSTAPTYHADISNVSDKIISGDAMPTSNWMFENWYLSFMFDEVAAPAGRARRFAQIFY